MEKDDFIKEKIDQNTEKIEKIISEILAISNLGKIQEEKLSAFLSGKEKGFLNFPSVKLIEIIRNNWSANPSIETLSSLIKERLDTTPEEAKKIASIIKKEIFESKEAINDGNNNDDTYREPIE